MGTHLDWDKDKAHRAVSYRENQTDSQSALNKAASAWLRSGGDPSRKAIAARDVNGKRVFLDASELQRLNRKTRHKHRKPKRQKRNRRQCSNYADNSQVLVTCGTDFDPRVAYAHYDYPPWEDPVGEVDDYLTREYRAIMTED
jgi:hypothetical protein